MKNSSVNIFREHLKVKSLCLHLSSPNANLNRIRRNLINKLQLTFLYTNSVNFTSKINPILIPKESNINILIYNIFYNNPKGEFSDNFFLNLLNQTDICRKIICTSILQNNVAHLSKIILSFIILYISIKNKKKRQNIFLYYKIRSNIIFSRIKDRRDYRLSNETRLTFLRTKLKDVDQQCSRRFFDSYVGVENICKCVSSCVVVKAVTPS